ncbi:MAG: hypothetical protein QM817_30465 [Archangium sp.]
MTDALLFIGAHRNVPIVVTDVHLVPAAPPELHIALELHYRVATPVCCGEPGCYVGFLGRYRERVPEALQRALALDAPPRVTIRAMPRHEPGYRHTQFSFACSDEWTATYGPEHFATAAAGPAAPRTSAERNPSAAESAASPR